MKRKGNPTIKILAVLVIAAVAGVAIISALSGGRSKPASAPTAPTVNDSATGDTPVETLKTLTATVSNVESQNQKIISSANQAQQQTNTELQGFEQSVASLKNEVTNLKDQNNDYKNQLEQVTEKQQTSSQTNYQYPLGDNDTSSGQNGFVWVPDVDKSDSQKSVQDSSNPFDSLLGNSNGQSTLATTAKKVLSTPYYTIPVNATLTGVIAMQPIVGEVPVDNQIVDPYHFKMIVGPKNLAANGIDIPSNIQGIVASGVAQGELIGPINKQSCVRGNITSMTFVFNDGRISTTQAQKGESLGTISNAQGFPCIPGILETNAPEYLGITIGLGALQGYANGLSQSQLNNSVTSTGSTISSLAGSYTKYAVGQAASSGASAAQQWFDNRMKNTTDLVVVDNVDPETHAYRHFNINVTKQIDINYNPQSRKVFYEHKTNIDQPLD